MALSYANKDDDAQERASDKKRWNKGGRLVRMSARQLNVHGTTWWVSERNVEGKERPFFIRLADVLRADRKAQCT